MPNDPTSRERWRPVDGFASYEVSDMGRVRRTDDGQELSQVKDKDGYPRVRLFLPGGGRPRGKRRKRLAVHRLVLLAFAGKPGPGEQCRHLNGNPSDNRLSNLSWGTAKENCWDTIRHGNWPRAERHPSNKLSLREANEILAWAWEGSCSQERIAELYGTTQCGVSEIKRGAKWRPELSSLRAELARLAYDERGASAFRNRRVSPGH